MELSDEFPDWELHCVGTGELWDDRAIHPKIIHHGFKQPHELAPHLVDAACFIMPSKKEPWGVVLHEMAIAGLPLLASRHVGAATEYLVSKKSGFEFLTANLVQELKQMIQTSEADRKVMGACSHELGLRHSHNAWVETLLKLS
jgi:glycosyltransferase involved in cell wall biosynthesis